MRYTFSITGPDRVAIAIGLDEQVIPGSPKWQTNEPNRLCTQFQQPGCCLHKLLTPCSNLLRQYSDQNVLRIVQLPESELSWLGHIREVSLSGGRILSLHIPDARIDEADADLPSICAALTEKLEKEAFRDDHELLRFLNNIRKP